MKTSKWKIIIFSIINYSLTNIIFYIIYFLGEFIIALLPENKIINFFLYYKGFFASSIMLGLTLCFTFQSFFLDLCFERYDDIRLVKLITGIFFLIFNIINLISVCFFHAYYLPSYVVLLIAGILLIIGNYFALQKNTKSKKFENNLDELQSSEDNGRAPKQHKPDILILVLSYIALIAISSCLILFSYDKGYSSGYSNGNVDGYNEAVDTWYDIGFSDAEGKYKVKHNSGDAALVWVADKDSRYHTKESCSNSSSPYLVTVDEAKDMGRKPCKKCYK